MGMAAEKDPIRHLLKEQGRSFRGTYIYGFVKCPQIVEGKGMGKTNIFHNYLHGNSFKKFIHPPLIGISLVGVAAQSQFDQVVIVSLNGNNPSFLEKPDDVFQAVAAIGIAEIAKVDHLPATLVNKDVYCLFGSREVSVAVRY